MPENPNLRIVRRIGRRPCRCAGALGCNGAQRPGNYLELSKSSSACRTVKDGNESHFRRVTVVETRALAAMFM